MRSTKQLFKEVRDKVSLAKRIVGGLPGRQTGMTVLRIVGRISKKAEWLGDNFPAIGGLAYIKG